MIVRFCLYSVLKNLRFADPFLVLYLLQLGLPFAEIGLLLGGQHLFTSLAEVPLGVAADRFGRRRSLAACFLAYAASFCVFALPIEAGDAALWSHLVVATALFGLGEALRTGSHKAIILDWLDSRGESRRATEVIGLARTYSKVSSGLSGLAAGIIVFAFSGYRMLFVLSAVAAFAAWILMLTYPRESEGETVRDARAGRRVSLPWRQRLRSLVAQPGMMTLFVQSVLFESQIKILLKFYAQPFLKHGLDSLGLPAVTARAGNPLRSSPIWIGVNEFVRDGLGGIAARASAAFERRAGTRRRALKLAYLGALAGGGLLAGCALAPRALLIPGLLVLIVLSMLQNVRRPIFVATFNEVMDKAQRATTLSIESQARALTVAVLLPVTGWAADADGFAGVFSVTAIVLVAGLLRRGGD